MKLNKFILSVAIIIMVFGCTDSRKDMPKFIPGKKLVLYSNDSGDIKIHDLEDGKEYSFNQETQDVSPKFIDRNRKLIFYNRFIQDGLFEVFDYLTGQKKYFKPQKKQDYLTIFLAVFNDSLVVYSNEGDLFIENLYTKNIATIALNAEAIVSGTINKEGILAIKYFKKGDENAYSMAPGLLGFVNVKSKEIIKTGLKVQAISDWSTSGEKLIIADSTFKVLEYPGLDVSRFDIDNLGSMKMTAQFKFLNDSLVVFVGLKSQNIFTDTHIYLYNLNQQQIIKKLTSEKGYKSLFDVYYLENL